MWKDVLKRNDLDNLFAALKKESYTRMKALWTHELENNYEYFYGGKQRTGERRRAEFFKQYGWTIDEYTKANPDYEPL